MSDCRKIADSAARLACYDQAAARLESAEQSGEVVVVDRAMARAARRQAFGFNLPSLNIFNRGEKPEAVDRASFVVARAYQDARARWVLETEEGQLWRQNDSTPLARRPRAGSKMEVRRAAMGSYFVNVDGQRALRASRER